MSHPRGTSQVSAVAPVLPWQCLQVDTPLQSRHIERPAAFWASVNYTHEEETRQSAITEPVRPDTTSASRRFRTSPRRCEARSPTRPSNRASPRSSSSIWSSSTSWASPRWIACSPMRSTGSSPAATSGPASSTPATSTLTTEMSGDKSPLQRDTGLVEFEPLTVDRQSLLFQRVSRHRRTVA